MQDVRIIVRRILLALLLVPSLAYAGGQGVLSGRAQIYPTAEKAYAATSVEQDVSDAVVVTILGEQGDVVHVATQAGADCFEPIDPLYQINGWVPRSALIPRLARPVVKTFSDGSAVAIDAGAPAIGGVLADDELAAGVPKVGPKDTAIGVTWSAAKLPATKAEEVVCKNGIKSRADFERDAAGEQRDADERERQDAPPPPPPKPKKKAAPKKERDCSKKKGRASQDCMAANVFDALTSDDDEEVASELSARRPGADLGLSRPSFEDGPACGLKEGSGKINGTAVRDVAEAFASYRDGAKGFIDRRATCGEVRVVGTLSESNGGGWGRGGGGSTMTVFKAGPLFWPDGTSAGKTVDETWIHEPETINNMLCGSVAHVAEKVCHRVKDVVK